MKKLIAVVSILSSFSALASMSDLADQVAQKVDAQLAAQQELILENELERLAQSAAISTDLHFNCSKSGVKAMAKYGISANCEATIIEALEFGFSEDEIIEAITRKDDLEKIKMSPELQELERLLEEDFADIEGR